MKVQKLDIDGLLLIDVKTFKDDRGFFAERYRKDLLAEIGIKADFIQDNFSRSAAGIIRGLHYQYEKPQAKLVTCTYGKILDVAVDIRKKSKTFGKHVRVILDGENPQWLWIPEGFAHGFCVLGDQPADLLYKVNAGYNPKGEGSILWSDTDLNISWGVSDPIISARDQKAMSFKEYCANTRF